MTSPVDQSESLEWLLSKVYTVLIYELTINALTFQGNKPRQACNLTLTVNLDIFALYIFSHFSRFPISTKICMTQKSTIYCLIEHDNSRKANLNPCEIASFLQFTTIYTRENIYVHSMSCHLIFWSQLVVIICKVRTPKNIASYGRL